MWRQRTRSRSFAAVAAALLLLLAGCYAAPASTPGPVTAPPEPPVVEAPPPAPEPEPEPPQPEVKLVEYTGPVEHIFFHPLIAYPELAFDGDSQSAGFDDWMVTVPEFRHIIADLYQNGYILVNMEDVLEVGAESVAARHLMLPEGKKPLIISVDDMNYYDYMRQNGIIHKLIVGDDGRVATWSVTPKGEERVAYDNEVVPILETFVAEHPDFSFHGARAIIALTGYEGILGYRTNKLGAPNYQQEREGALRVVERLKATGWRFASHSWGHLDMAKVSYETFAADLRRWQADVESLIGHTPIYIYPFGSGVKPGDRKYELLVSAGFRILCTVGPTPYQPAGARVVTMERRHIDGLALRTQARSLRHLFDAAAVLDPVRPKR